MPVPARPLRRLATLTALPLLLACPAVADTLRPAAPVSAVTLFPSGAEVSRQITLEAAAGRHQVIVTGLPQRLDPATLRISATGGQLAAFALQDRRALPDTAPEPAPVAEARAALDAARAALAAFDRQGALLRAQAEAKADMIAIFNAMGTASDAQLEPGRIELAATLEERLLALRRDVIRIEGRIAALEPERRPHRRAVEAAEAALDAVLSEQTGTTALVMDVAATGSGPLQLTITTLSPDAWWEPVYDLRLDSSADRIRLDRGVMLRQETGEDWAGVQVALSTARPSGQIAPSTIAPLLVHAVNPPPPGGHDLMVRAPAPMAEMAEMASAGAAPKMEATVTGPVVTYAYGEPVDLRSGADALRLAMGTAEMEAEVRAKGNAAFDAVAYLHAEARNTGALILPGPAGLYADGVMVGQTSLPLIAAGDRIEQGFGPIDGLVLERRVPHRRDGERGLIRRANAIEDEVQVVVTNHTDRDWSLLLTDHMPVAEQDEVTVSWQATPAPDRTAPKGARGVVEWDLHLAPEAEQVITIETRIDWPRDKELRGYP